MLAVILKILSVTGIVLLCILGLLLVLVLLVLILPVRYSLRAYNKDETGPHAVFRLTYFLRIIKALAVYENKKVSVTVKVLWFKLFSARFPEEDTDEDLTDDEFDSLLEDELACDSESKTEPDEVIASDEGFKQPEYDQEMPDDDPYTEETDDDSVMTEDDAEDSETGSGNSDKSISDDDNHENAVNESDEEDTDRSDGLSGLIDKLKCKYESFYDKIRKVRSEYRYYRNILNSNEASYAYRVIVKRLRKILKLILPRKAKCDLTYGFSSPDITGKVYGIYCLIAGRFAKGSRVIADFERSVFDGHMEAVGHFNLMGILINAACVILNKNCRKIYKSLKHHRDRNNSGYESRDEENGSGKAA